MIHNNHTDCIIIGAGAAGLFCGGLLTKKGKTVRVLDHADKIGKKILISGGGRCNFTNRIVKPEHFISENPHFCKSALAGYNSDDFIELVEKHQIHYHEKTLGQLFCNDSSKQIVTMLQHECISSHIDIRLHATVSNVESNELFTVHTNLGVFTSQCLIIATGGLSIPKMGATSFGYEIAKQYGHSIIPTKPALVPLIVNQEVWPCSELAGLSFNVIAQTGNSPEFTESMLFTHKGLSGPAILQISSYYHQDQRISLNVIPHINIHKVAEDAVGKIEWKSFLSTYVPKRFSELWTQRNRQLENASHYSVKTKIEYLEGLCNWSIPILADEGYDKAEVTSGGINTKELSSKTMMSLKQNNLYFIGELLDVTGHLGGYNFQWAWSSAYAAAMSIQ